MGSEEFEFIAERYRLIHSIGVGGMAEVWLAADTRLNDKKVAVKRLLRSSVRTPKDTERVRREAFAAASLDHPNVVAVTDFIVEDGSPYIVMEYVRGTSLTQLSATGPMPEGEAIRVMAQISDAVTAAHHAGLLHRDIKPSNILVTASGVGKLADFGIARRFADPRTTQVGFLTGTPVYMAPELFNGLDASEASDVWSLGVSLFEAIEGRAPFGGDTHVAVLTAIALKPVPAATRASPALAGLIAEMLSRDPAARPSAEAVTHRLRLLTGAPADSAYTVRTSAPETITAVTMDDFLFDPTPAAGTTVGVKSTPLPGGSVPVAHESSAGSRRHRVAWVAVGATVALLAGGGVVLAQTVHPGSSRAGGESVSPKGSVGGSSSAGTASASARSIPSAASATHVAATTRAGASSLQPPASQPTTVSTVSTVTIGAAVPPAVPANRVPAPTVTAAIASHTGVPTLTLPALKTSDEQDRPSFAIAAGDPDGDPVTVTVTSALPAGISFANRTFSGLIGIGAVNRTTAYTDIQSADFVITVKASDNYGHSRTGSFIWRVRDTYLDMPNYRGLFGDGDGGYPNVGNGLSANRSLVGICVAGNSGLIWEQSVAPGAAFKWGVTAVSIFYPSTASNCSPDPHAYA